MLSLLLHLLLLALLLSAYGRLALMRPRFQFFFLLHGLEFVVVGDVRAEGVLEDLVDLLDGVDHF